MALISALTAATASAKHFCVKVIKCLVVMCIDAAVTEVSVSSVTSYMRLVTITNVVGGMVAEVDELDLTSPIVQEART